MQTPVTVQPLAHERDEAYEQVPSRVVTAAAEAEDVPSKHRRVIASTQPNLAAESAPGRCVCKPGSTTCRSLPGCLRCPCLHPALLLPCTCRHIKVGTWVSCTPASWSVRPQRQASVCVPASLAPSRTLGDQQSQQTAHQHHELPTLTAKQRQCSTDVASACPWQLVMTCGLTCRGQGGQTAGTGHQGAHTPRSVSVAALREHVRGPPQTCMSGTL